MTPVQLTVRVARKNVEAQDICSFELVDALGRPLPTFSAGSHIDVHVREGLVRQYSLCNNAGARDRYVIGVLRDPKSRGGSVAMHDDVHEGAELQVSAPRNHFALAAHAPKSLLLAGGIGITPLLCMAEQLAQAGDAFELHYCTRSMERTAFMHRLRSSAFANAVNIYFDVGPPEQRLNIDALLSRTDQNTHIYVCGPLGFIEAVLTSARSAGWLESNLHYEYFAGQIVNNQDAEMFDIVLASSGRIVPVKKDQTVVQALALAGIDIPTSCEQGVCGTCLTRVMEGEPDHRDMYLTDAEHARNDRFLPCCSRSKSPRLVIDL